ncbi:MAG: hypothetical protein WA324_11030 [Bryobacteraceae bacterium]
MRFTTCLVFAGLLAYSPIVRAQTTIDNSPNEPVDQSNSPLRVLIERFTSDRYDLARYYNIRIAEDRRERFRRFYHGWEDRLAGLNFDAMNEDGQVDYILFHNFLDHQLKQIDFEARQASHSASYVPFAATITSLEEARRNGNPVHSQAAAATLSQLRVQIDALRTELAKPPANTDSVSSQERKIDANRAADEVEILKQNPASLVCLL